MDQVKLKVEKALREKGLLEKRELVWEKFGVGVRVTLIEGRDRQTRTVATITTESLRGTPRDQANGIVGALIAKIKAA